MLEPMPGGGLDHWRDHAKEVTRHEERNVGVVDAPIAAFLCPGFRPCVRWLPPPAGGTFRADPFVAAFEGREVLFYEAWSASTGRGRLMAQDLVAGNPSGRPRALQGLRHRVAAAPSRSRSCASSLPACSNPFTPRPVYVLYVGGWCRALWDGTGEFETLGGHYFDRCYCWRGF